jgi:hypothetical protein
MVSNPGRTSPSPNWQFCSPRVALHNCCNHLRLNQAGLGDFLRRIRAVSRTMTASIQSTASPFSRTADPRRGARAEPGGRMACASCHRLHVASSRAGVKWESTPQSPSLTPLPPPFHRPLVRRAAPPRPRRGRASSPPHCSLPNFTHSSALGSLTFPYIVLDQSHRGKEVLSTLFPPELTGASPPPRSTVASSPPSFSSFPEPRSHLRNLWGCLWLDIIVGNRP